MNRSAGTPLGRKPDKVPDVELTEEDLARLPVLRRTNRRSYGHPAWLSGGWHPDLAPRMGRSEAL